MIGSSQTTVATQTGSRQVSISNRHASVRQLVMLLVMCQLRPEARLGSQATGDNTVIQVGEENLSNLNPFLTTRSTRWTRLGFGVKLLFSTQEFGPFKFSLEK
jgi:hypothetical protein